ncbi:hypothetical protein [Roseibacillus persicicus]|uniref:Lipoprotein n=1 Tax=Roseibacillus persicicus TaxID=454148 RepID=A0A918TYL2_9BACT|nr:hypothetical protein [Roseibacillus persicicus]GHC67888.1 hypothetical protein GCM10007100_40030 [Roseibacillus persicicus]
MKTLRLVAVLAAFLSITGCEERATSESIVILPTHYNASSFFDGFNFDPLPVNDDGETLVPWVCVSGTGLRRAGPSEFPPYSEYLGRFEYVGKTGSLPVGELLKLVQSEFQEAHEIEWASEPSFEYFYKAEYEVEAGLVGYISLVFIPDVAAKSVTVGYSMTETLGR